MKRRVLIGIGVLVLLIIIGYVLFGNSASDLPEPRLNGTSEGPSIQDEPSLASDSDVFNEFDAALDGLS